MSPEAVHRCPICCLPMEFSARTPRAVCPACASQTVDELGRRVRFYNQDMSGGIEGVLVDTGEKFADEICYIKGWRCRAGEAHMGGIVISLLD